MSSDSERTILQRLKDLNDLFESGLITKEEMEVKKRQILGTDNPSVDSSNEEVKDILNDNGFGQTEDSYRHGKFYSSTPDIEIDKEKPKESDGLQGDGEKKETTRKLSNDLKLIIKLTLIVAAVLAIIIVLPIITAPTDYNQKVEKAIEKHRSEHGDILSTSGIGKSTEDNHYVIFERGGTIFYDGLERGVPAREIMPREEGFVFKQIIPGFKDGKPTITYKLLNEGERSNIKLGIKESKGGLITRRTEAKCNVLNGDKAICIEDIVSNEKEDGAMVNSSYYYSMSNPDTVYVFHGSLIHAENESYCKQDFSFLDVFDGKEDGLWSPFSYNDYRFTMRIVFPNLDPKSLGFDYIYIEEESFPMDLISDKFYYSEEDGCLRIPAVWFNKGKMDVVFECLERDMKRKYREKETSANTFTLEQLCNIRLQSSSKFGGESFDERFPIGKELNLVARAESIDYSSAIGYKYIIKATKGLGLEVEANIYTNDDSFVDLNYPVFIGVKVSFGGTYTEKKSLLAPRMRIFDFYDAELLGWENK